MAKVIYMTYFKNKALANIPVERQLSIALSPPAAFKGDKTKLRRLFPKAAWINEAHSGLWHRYVEHYSTILDNFTADELFELIGEENVIICHCMPWQNCHRQLIADKLKAGGYTVIEMEMVA